MKSWRSVVAGLFLAAGPAVAADSVYEFTMDSIDGAPQSLSFIKGRCC